MKKFVSAVTFLLSVACGYNTLTAPDGGEVRLVSALGFRIEAYNQTYLDGGGTVTQLHADKADQWWSELMADLRAAGYTDAQTDPKRNAEWVSIALHTPLQGMGYIDYPGGGVVGGYYDQLSPAFHVPGDYPTATWPGRPNAQPLKHEMLHHWCNRTLHHMCMEPGKSEWEGHHWAAPDGTDVWLLTWR